MSEAKSRIVAVPGTSTIIHLCLDVRGALMNWNDRNMKGVFRHDDGRPMTSREARSFLMDEIAKGHKVSPCGECDNFSYETGCGGHVVPAPDAAAADAATNKKDW